MTTSSSSFAEHVARTSAPDYRPGPDQQKQVSRLPDLFKSLYEEEWSAMGLLHQIEDVEILNLDDGEADELSEGKGIFRTCNSGDGISQCRIRIVPLIWNSAPESDYTEWLLENEEPYWRILFRTFDGQSACWPRIVAVSGARAAAGRFARHARVYGL